MPQPANNLIVIVDGHSSCVQLPPVMKNHGWQCIHVQSSATMLPFFRAAFRPEDYVERFVFDGNLANLTEWIKPFAPAAVFPGTESGVILANQLAQALNLPGNDPQMSKAHRDKYAMGQCIQSRGLRAVDQYLAEERTGLVNWANRGAWPVVLKPVASGGTDSVKFCQNENELVSDFQNLHQTFNQLGERNDTLLAQRMLRGQEYFVNGIGGYGHHIITEVWRTDKIKIEGAGLMYDRNVLFDPADPAVTHIVDYIYQVLDALGIEYGASHTEVMDTDQGPTLIESAARLSGGINRDAVLYALGASQIDLLASLAIEGETFIQRLAKSGMPLRYPVWQVQLISNQTGTVEQVFLDKLVADLQSKVWLNKMPEPGDTITRTVDLFTTPGLIFISHADPAVLQADYQTIRAWEREQKLFKVKAG
jgi:hypothetical protein